MKRQPLIFLIVGRVNYFIVKHGADGIAMIRKVVILYLQAVE